MRNAAPHRVGLCSACRGDYEDPDASALDGDPSASTDDESDDDQP